MTNKRLKSKGGGGGRRDKDVLGNEIKPKVDWGRFNFATGKELRASGFPEDWGSSNGTITKRSTPYTPGSNNSKKR